MSTWANASASYANGVCALSVAGTQIDFDVIREGHRVLVEVGDAGGLRIEIRQAEDEV